ncbi:MAG: hypothetical protein ACRDP1_13310, partial [Nocardioidaceae bacterium]
MTKPKTAPAGAVEKRRVTMTSYVADATGTVHTHEAVDYVPTDLLAAYEADARTRWQNVAVDHDGGHDPGPGGDQGDTHRPP